jgi:hypothetical protein
MVSTPDRAQLGSMADQDVVQVWRNNAYQSFRAALNSDEPPAICRGCAVYRGEF